MEGLPPNGKPTPTPLLHVATLHRLVAELLTEAMVPAGMGPGDYAVCSVVLDEPGLTITDLADRFAVPLATMSDHVRDLTRRGLVQRTPDERDRRRLGLALTDLGRDAHREAGRSFGTAYVEFRRHCATGAETQIAVLQEMIAAAGAALRAGRSGRGSQP